ncbi:MAG: DUF4276 family protein [Candidatus Tectomicrobia bacterium]|uniref:DUF4276 family protein n=1 Tax=Tectimicrobiota bacterium TaxID=2528274 RepID=A0A937VWY2_UNCTE|nr:DUF4276 family protein [Candidatus Tectomicrobia bacterium]
MLQNVERDDGRSFAVQVLQPHLAAHNVFVTKPRLTGPHGRRGGRIPPGGMFGTFAHVLQDIKRWLREDTSPAARFSMMVDLYAIPHDVPGYADAMVRTDPYAQAERLEDAFADAIQEQPTAGRMSAVCFTGTDQSRPTRPPESPHHTLPRRLSCQCRRPIASPSHWIVPHARAVSALQPMVNDIGATRLYWII